MVDRVCANCGDPFQVKYPSSERRYCDKRECRGATRRGRQRPELWKRETFVCVVCGKEFERGGRKRPKDQVTCSLECGRLVRYRHGVICKELTETEAAYLAGLWDADGSFIIHGNTGPRGSSFRAQIGVTKKVVIDWVVDHTGIGVRFDRKSRNPLHADVYRWHINGDGAESFTRQLIPYLVLKRPQAELGVEFQERLRDRALKADRTWQEEYRARMTAMNRRGRQEEI